MATQLQTAEAFGENLTCIGIPVRYLLCMKCVMYFFNIFVANLFGVHKGMLNGVNRFADGQIWPLKAHIWIAGFCVSPFLCVTLSGLVDFRYAEDHRSAKNFSLDFSLCLFDVQSVD